MEAVTGGLLTVKEAAKFLHMHERTLRQMIREGEVPHVKLGRRMTRFRKSDLLIYIEAHSIPAAEAS